MKIDFSKLSVRPISLDEIGADTLTDFSLGRETTALEESISKIGVTHPVALCQAEGESSFRIACGHRRAGAARHLKLDHIPAVVVEEKLNPEACLKLNLLDNLNHRRYSDIEKGMILIKLTDAGAKEEVLIDKYLPLLELERSKRLLADFLKTRRFSIGLNQALHEMKIPLRVFSVLFEWGDADRDAAESLLSHLKPGVNKWREFLELTDELARREEVSPCVILKRHEICSVMENEEIPGHQKYESICQALRELRYPALSELRKKFLLALDKLDLDPRTKVRVAKYFENDEIKIELKFTRQEDLIKQAQKLAGSAGSEAMKELIKIVKGEESH